MTERENLIHKISISKDLAIEKGYDWPTQNINEATTEELDAFYGEVFNYIIFHGID
jgi:hypothetical protein